MLKNKGKKKFYLYFNYYNGIFFILDYWKKYNFCTCKSFNKIINALKWLFYIKNSIYRNDKLVYKNKYLFFSDSGKSSKDNFCIINVFSNAFKYLSGDINIIINEFRDLLVKKYNLDIFILKDFQIKIINITNNLGELLAIYFNIYIFEKYIKKYTNNKYKIYFLSDSALVVFFWLNIFSKNENIDNYIIIDIINIIKEIFRNNTNIQILFCDSNDNLSDIGNHKFINHNKKNFFNFSL